MHMTSQCPDPSSHRQNAEEQFFGGQPVPEVVTQEQDEAIQAIADAEERHCEGH